MDFMENKNEWLHTPYFLFQVVESDALRHEYTLKFLLLEHLFFILLEFY